MKYIRILRSLAVALVITLAIASISAATVTVETVKNVYSGSGTAGPFTYAFKIWTSADLRVVKTDPNGLETTLLLNTDYTVTGAGTTTGGTVTLTSVLPAGYTLTLIRDMDYLQSTAFTAGQAISSTSVNQALDRLEHQIQQLAESSARAFQLPRSSVWGPLYLQPQAQYLIGWDSAGTALKNYATTTVSVPTIDHIGNYSDNLTTAVAAIGSSRQLLQVQRGIALTASVTTPETLELWVPEGGQITLGAYNLVINGPFRGSPNCFVQNGIGRVTFGPAALAGGLMPTPRWWGGKGDESVDDTLACNAAAASLPYGGRVDMTWGRWLIDSADLLVPQGVILVGPFEQLGEQISIDYTTVRGVIVLNPSYTVRLWGNDAGVRGLGIFRKGLTKPTSIAEATTLVNSFAGTGVTFGYTTPTSGAQYNKARAGYAGHLLILGFQWGIWCDYNERPAIEWVKGDCTNGIYLSRIYDMKNVSNCHWWPFITTHQAWTFAGPAGYSRTGTAFFFDTDSHWGSVHTMFSFGYAVGYRLNNALYIDLINCSNDHQADMNVLYGLTPIGVHVTGSSGNVQLIGHRSAAQADGVKVEIDATRSLVNSTYKWTAGTGSEYYCELAAGGDPAIALPTDVAAGGTQLARGTAAGSLAAGQWIYAMDPGSTFWTVYVRLSDSTDPDTKAAGYVTIAPVAGAIVKAIGCTFWGQTDNHVNVVSGSFHTSGSLYKDLYGAGTGILAASTAYEVVIGDSNEFDGLNTPWNLTAIKRGSISPTNRFHRAYQPGTSWYKDIRDYNANNVGVTDIYNDATSGAVRSTRKAGGTAASPAAAPTNTNIDTADSYAWTGSAWGRVAAYRTTLRGAASAGSTPGAIIFSTTSSGSAAVTDRIIINEDGNLQPVTDNVYKLGGSGLRWTEVWATNGTIQTSDERAKKAIATSSLGLDFVGKLKPIEYEWQRDTGTIAGRKHYGFSAQDVQAALAGKDFGGLIYDSENDLYGINYAEFLPILTAAIQEQQRQIEALRAEVAKQKEPAKQ